MEAALPVYQDGHWLCPDCQRPLRVISEEHREYVCPIALRGLMEGKLNTTTHHREAMIWKEKSLIA